VKTKLTGLPTNPAWGEFGLAPLPFDVFYIIFII
jgi:hypothetical protein